MAARLIDGKAVSEKLREALKERVDALVSRGITPCLAVVLVGENPASKVYVKNKKRACAKAGMRSEQHDLPADVAQEELLGLIGRLNRDPAVHGILVQLPLPAHLDERAACAAVAPEKDVDAFHLENIGAVMRGDYRFVPCTPAGVMELLGEAGIEIAGRECVVVGRSNIVGKPMAMLLLQRDATVTVCHSRTRNLAEVCRRADILVSAVGRPRFITADMVKPEAAVIDVGINHDNEGRLCGDVDFEAALETAGCITPVPGGVGPMTIAMLLENTVRAAEALI